MKHFVVQCLVLVLLVIFQSEAQSRSNRECILNGERIPCDSPKFIDLLTGKSGVQIQRERNCFVNDKPVSCDSKEYLAITSGTNLDERQCVTNGRSVPCDDLIIPSNGKLSGNIVGSYNRLCYLNSKEIDCDNPEYLESVKVQNSDGTVCRLNNKPVSCNDPVYQKALKDQSLPGKACYINDRPISCADLLNGKVPSNKNTVIGSNNVIVIDGGGSTTVVPPIRTSTMNFENTKGSLCGRRLNSVQKLIVNGENANLGEFPWLVAIYEKDRSNKKKFICGGTILTPFVVISAAHCFTNEADENYTTKEPEQFVVVVGKVSLDYGLRDSKSTKYHTIDNIYIDGFYGASARHLNDVAILSMKNQIEISYTVHPICFPLQDNKIRDEMELQVAGWGEDGSKKLSERLKTIKVPYVTQNKCLQKLPEDDKENISGDKFCVYHRNGTALKPGDSGSGVIHRVTSEDRYYLVGIVSFRMKNEENVPFTVVTNVNLFKKFISDKIDKIHNDNEYFN